MRNELRIDSRNSHFWSKPKIMGWAG